MGKQFFCRTGSKLSLLKKILPLIPPHTKYVEAFVGGGAVFWNKEPAEKEVLNDLDKPLIEGYKLLKSMKNKVPSDFPIQSGAKNIQKLIDKTNPTKEERLLQMLYHSCNTFSSKGVGKIYNPHSQKNKINRIEEFVDRLKNTTITNQDYKKVLKQHDSKDTFFFLDPPYEESKGLYTEHSIDYEEMNQLLKSLKGKFLLTINDSPFIRNIFKGFIIKGVLLKSINPTSTIGRKDRRELFIMNYTLKGGEVQTGGGLPDDPLTEKPTELLQNEVVKTAHKFAISNKIKVIGSNAMRGLLYPSDLDFISEFHQRPKALANELKRVFSDKKFMLSIYFMDFKCGLDTRFAPYKEEERDKWLLRWTKKDVINGYVKLHDGETKTLEDCFLDDTIIKIDWIYRQPLAECSLNIQYKQEPPTKEEEIATLKEDINEYLGKNTFKSMKRLYSLLVLTKKNKPLQKQLVEYFNSPAGIVNKGRNDLVLIQTLLESHPFVDVDSEIQQIKANMGCVPFVSASVLKKMKRATLDKTIEYLDDLLNKISKAVLAELQN